MEYRNDLKSVTKVWWRFFWRYVIMFVAVNLFAGVIVNFLGNFLPKGLYMITMLSGIFANIVDFIRDVLLSKS